jgi:fructokinase
MAVHFVALGHVLCETIVYADGSRKGPILGSPPAYASTVAARLGVSTGIVTKVGPDAPTDLLQPLREAGVDLDGVDFSSEVTTTNELLYSVDGSKELKYRKQAGEISFVDIPEKYHKAAVFHVCPLDYEISPATISKIASLGGILGLDLGGYGGAHVNRETNATRKLSLSVLGDLVNRCTVVKASDEDARLLLAGEDLPELEVGRQLVSWGAEVGVVTLGSRGSIVVTKRGEYRIAAIEEEVVDVTGGGDSFIAGFLLEYWRTGDPEQAGLFGTAVAAQVIKRTGGVLAERMPIESAVREQLRQRLVGH